MTLNKTTCSLQTTHQQLPCTHHAHVFNTDQTLRCKDLRSPLLPQNSSGKLHPHTASLFPRQPMDFIISGTEEKIKSLEGGGGSGYTHRARAKGLETQQQAEFLVYEGSSLISKLTPGLNMQSQYPCVGSSHVLQICRAAKYKGRRNPNFPSTVLFSDLANWKQVRRLS